jgi:putative nucleotidyltransferase with HDIG domain
MFAIVNKMFVVEPNLYSHSHHVSLLCVMLAKAMKWTSQTTSQIFSLAGLYHDTGKIKLPEHLRMKRPENMTKEELVEYRKHPILSVQEIKEIKKIPPVVPQIIIQHHENLLGTGFPAGLRSNDMTQGAKILAVANDFTNLITFNPEFKGKPREAAQFMLLNPDRIYMQELLVALLQIFLA